MKICGDCLERKPLSDFVHYKSGVHAGRPKSHCKPCGYARTQEWRKANPDKVAAQTGRRQARSQVDGRSRRQRYGVALNEWAEMSADGCRICGTREGLVCDHDHDCCPGKRSCGRCVRGALCGPCNRAIGLMQDDPDRLIAAAAYLLQRVNVLEGI